MWPLQEVRLRPQKRQVHVYTLPAFHSLCHSARSLEPEWAAAATDIREQTKGKVLLGAVDATVHQGLSSRYGVSVGLGI